MGFVRGACKVTVALETSQHEDKLDFVLFGVIIYPSKGPRTYILSTIPATALTIMLPFSALQSILYLSWIGHIAFSHGEVLPQTLSIACILLTLPVST